VPELRDYRVREVNFARDIIYGIADLLGIDPTEDLLKDHARAWTSSVNNHVGRGWGFWPWPELEVTEERAFRQVFYTDVAYQAGQGEASEVYYPATEKYYRMTASAAAGTLPTDPAKWTEIGSDALDRHIAFEQYGKQNIDRIISIDPTDPRLFPGNHGWSSRPSSYGTDVLAAAGPTVWVTYIPRAPEFTTSTYDAAKAYARGDLVLDLVSGDCYRALAASTGQLLTNQAYWLREAFPYLLAQYVKYAAAAEQSGDAQEQAIWAGIADGRLKDEVDKLIGQGQVSFYGRKMTIPPKPFGVSWDYYRAYWASAAMG
jgi:hypothetical protein